MNNVQDCVLLGNLRMLLVLLHVAQRMLSKILLQPQNLCCPYS